jgi:ComF family protein
MIDWAGRIRRGVSGLAASGCRLLFPPRCTCCDRELWLADADGDGFLCMDCLERLGPERWRGCRRCAGEIKFIEGGDPIEFLPDRCPLCRDAALRFDAAVALGSYHAGLRKIILRMKKPAHDALSIAMARLLVRRRREQLAGLQADMVIPIPMFWIRRLGRGVNSADTLALFLANSLGLSLSRNILVRRRNTQPQANLSPTRRFQNVRGAFRVRWPRAIKDARILLVDDVLTTGATCSEAAKTLLQAGAASVAVAVIARAQGSQG